jgi:hypothetical protein
MICKHIITARQYDPKTYLKIENDLQTYPDGQSAAGWYQSLTGDIQMICERQQP